MKGYALHPEFDVLRDLRDLRGSGPSCASWIGFLTQRRSDVVASGSRLLAIGTVIKQSFVESVAKNLPFALFVISVFVLFVLFVVSLFVRFVL